MQKEIKVLPLKMMYLYQLHFKNQCCTNWQCARFRCCNATYNLLEYSKNYRKTTGSLCNYYRDEPSNPLCSNSESFKYKTSITGKTYDADAAIIGDGDNPISNPDYDANKVGK